jgi:chromosome partitioning protein
VNLAAAIARAGRSVLLIDLDPQAHASLHLGVDAAQGLEGGGVGGSVYDVLQDPASAAGALRSARPNLWVLPSETDLAAAEMELADLPAAERTTRLRRALEALAAAGRRFDFVMLDCPPSLGVLTLNALAAAREVFIPMQAQFLALQGVGKLLETVGLVSRSVNPRLRVTGVILCMHDAGTTHAREVVADLSAYFDRARSEAKDVPWKTARLLQPPIRRNIKLAECPSFGQTIFDYAPTCPGAADYQALGERVIADLDALRSRMNGEGAAKPEVSVKVVVDSGGARA